VPIKMLWVIMDQMYGQLLVNMNSSSWSYGRPIVLEFSYCICDNKDKPFVSNCTFKGYNCRPYVNNSLLLMDKASSLIRFDVKVCIVSTSCWID
jgi:hypothetical protein